MTNFVNDPRYKIQLTPTPEGCDGVPIFGPYQVFELNQVDPEEGTGFHTEDFVFFGRLADCESYIRLKNNPDVDF